MSNTWTNTPDNFQDPHLTILSAVKSFEKDATFNLEKTVELLRENNIPQQYILSILWEYVKKYNRAFEEWWLKNSDFFDHLESKIELQPSQDAVWRERAKVQEKVAPQIKDAQKSGGIKRKHVVVGGALGLSGAALVAGGYGAFDDLAKKPVTLEDLQVGNTHEYHQEVSPEEHKLILWAFEDISSLLSDGDTIISMDIDGNFSEMQLDLMASLNRAMAACNNELDPTNMLQEVPGSCEDSIGILRKMTDGQAEEILAELGKKQGFNVNMQIKTLDTYMDMVDTHTIELDTLKKDPNTHPALLLIGYLMLIFALLYLLHGLKQGERFLRKDATTWAMDNIHAAKDIDKEMYPMIKMVSEKMRILRPIFDRIMKQQNNVPDIYKSEIDDPSNQKPAERPLTPDERQEITKAYSFDGLKRTDDARRRAAEEWMSNPDLRVEWWTITKTDWKRGTSEKIAKSFVKPVKYMPFAHKWEIYQIQEDSYSWDKSIYVFDEKRDKYMGQLYTNHGITDIDANKFSYEWDHDDPNQQAFVAGMIWDQKVWLSLSSEEIRKR